MRESSLAKGAGQRSWNHARAPSYAQRGRDEPRDRPLASVESLAEPGFDVLRSRLGLRPIGVAYSSRWSAVSIRAAPTDRAGSTSSSTTSRASSSFAGRVDRSQSAICSSVAAANRGIPTMTTGRRGISHASSDGHWAQSRRRHRAGAGQRWRPELRPGHGESSAGSIRQPRGFSAMFAVATSPQSSRQRTPPAPASDSLRRCSAPPRPATRPAISSRPPGRGCPWRSARCSS